LSEEFIREVDEDLRQKQLTGVWQKYGSYVIAFLIGTILFVAGNVTLKNYNESQYAKVADQYSKVEQSVIANDMGEALKNLATLSDTDVNGYKILAAFKEADIELEQGNQEKAIAALDKLVNAAGVDKVYRDLASLKAAMIALDSASYDDIKSRLAPLTIEGNAWKYIAKELLAMSALLSGNAEEAKNLLTQLEQDLEAPDDVKNRAKDFKSVIE
ncbi:MAG: tetratricopeptide repeat protein, partial [Emcibacter sp.]|nr:tetratricopeptide repeat protein [Emcibacter sp.]